MDFKLFGAIQTQPGNADKKLLRKCKTFPPLVSELHRYYLAVESSETIPYSHFQLLLPELLGMKNTVFIELIFFTM